VDARLLEILVCPICKGPLSYDRPAQTVEGTPVDLNPGSVA
jgi:uncharacterized protein YbaR (Trm112 family)